MGVTIDVSAHLHVRTFVGDVPQEQWKASCSASKKIEVGMCVRFCEAGDPITIREGVIGGIRTHERHWIEFWLVLDSGLAGTLSVTLLIPFDWVQLGFLDRIVHFCNYQSLPDRTPGPFKANALSGVHVPRRFLQDSQITFGGASS
ncbi:hypothetical protein GALMADRAFT_1326685 [Galerina marginata CBS 339.88]|uniref:Uncharacterized protein n=1 Tax=Galerina marginata (strain CBS 339.88) TaxID=685588 RepID=A0A067TCX4_GALM3|nr:hypothetical protein GALMADRAFT_1326685 [Galerina marginata CBS 339.88]